MRIKKFPKKIYLSPPYLNGNELDYISKAIDSKWIAPKGPHLNEFENSIAEYVGREYCVALSSGTAALHLALKVLGIKKGDYIFCSDLTFVASANAIKYLDAIPIFIDSDYLSWNMCPKSLKKAFKTFSPQAVIVTDLYGQSANYDEIIQICKQKRVPIIEDSAESLGAEYLNRKCGSFGDISILSFNGNKIITTSGGGMILSNNEDYISKAKKLSTQSRENELHYEHIEIGYNYRLSNILASIGLAQLNHLDEIIFKKRSINKSYKNILCNEENILFMPEIKGGKSTYWLSAIILNDISFEHIQKIINYFLNLNVELRNIWKPMHLQPLYKSNEFISVEKKPVSEYLFIHGICLPSGCSLKYEDQKKISRILINQIRSQ